MIQHRYFSMSLLLAALLCGSRAVAGDSAERAEIDWLAGQRGAFAQWPAAVAAQMERRSQMTVEELYLDIFREYKQRVIQLRHPSRTGMDPKQADARDYLPKELNPEADKLLHEAIAKVYPAIPAWLGEAAPLATVFLPGDRIATHGALGQRYSDKLSEFDLAPEVWRVYSVEGKLLGTFPPPDDIEKYMFVVLPEWPWKQAAPGEAVPAARLFGSRLPESNEHGTWWHDLGNGPFLEDPTRPDNWGLTFNTEAPFIYNGYDDGFVVGPPPKLLAAYDWDGQPLDPKARVPARRSGLFWELRTKELTLVYQAQVRLGLTDPLATSPYAGTAEGPVVAADSQPRQPQAWTPVEPRALDDPQNPYRGRYAAWDYWAMQQPRESDASLYEDDNGNVHGDPGFDGRLARAFNVSVELDKDRFPLPLRAQWQAEASRLLLADARSKPDLWGRQRKYDRFPKYEYPNEAVAYARHSKTAPFRRAQQQAMRPLFPDVPDCLLTAPVKTVVALPDGRFCVLGKPGSFDPTPLRGYGREKTLAIWYLYDEDGIELANTGEHYWNAGLEWVELTWPGFKRVKQDAADAGHHVEVKNGFTLVWDNPGTTSVKLKDLVPPGTVLDESEDEIELERHPEQHLLAAYDWDGTRLPLDRPLQRPLGYCLELPWQLVSAFLSDL
jgi:hypothetical protein